MLQSFKVAPGMSSIVWSQGLQGDNLLNTFLSNTFSLNSQYFSSTISSDFASSLTSSTFLISISFYLNTFSSIFINKILPPSSISFAFSPMSSGSSSINTLLYQCLYLSRYSFDDCQLIDRLCCWSHSCLKNTSLFLRLVMLWLDKTVKPLFIFLFFSFLFII